ncbi:MAG: response regulator [Calditrichaeota bacterium]|nr:response regulator [Calditrichota bacterium]
MAGNIKLLIVDDEVKFLDAIAERLKMRGFDVAKATDGYQALEIAKNEKFDLALLDLKMPGMDGKQVLAEIKTQHKFIEVIILTGHGSLESAVECTKLGAFSYLPKPYELDKLIDTLRSAYEARMRKKFAIDEARMAKIQQIATGQSALGILRSLRELDDDVK